MDCVRLVLCFFMEALSPFSRFVPVSSVLESESARFDLRALKRVISWKSEEEDGKRESWPINVLGCERDIRMPFHLTYRIREPTRPEAIESPR